MFIKTFLKNIYIEICTVHSLSSINIRVQYPQLFYFKFISPFPQGVPSVYTPSIYLSYYSQFVSQQCLLFFLFIPVIPTCLSPAQAGQPA